MDAGTVPSLILRSSMASSLSIAFVTTCSLSSTHTVPVPPSCASFVHCHLCAGRPSTLSEPRLLHVKCGGASLLLCANVANGAVVVFHCVHGSPEPAGRKKRSTGPNVAVTSDVNML